MMVLLKATCTTPNKTMMLGVTGVEPIDLAPTHSCARSLSLSTGLIINIALNLYHMRNSPAMVGCGRESRAERRDGHQTSSHLNAHSSFLLHPSPNLIGIGIGIGIGFGIGFGFGIGIGFYLTRTTCLSHNKHQQYSRWSILRRRQHEPTHNLASRLSIPTTMTTSLSPTLIVVVL
jgi:hypothetical protein